MNIRLWLSWCLTKDHSWTTYNSKHTKKTIRICDTCQLIAVGEGQSNKDKPCDNHCDDTPWYGWVPEAGCEVHDAVSEQSESSANSARKENHDL